jgi:hypothetical protein
MPLRGAWDDTTDSVTQKLVIVRDQAASVLQQTATKENATANWDMLIYRGVSDALGAQTIAGSLTGVINASGGPFANHVMRTHIHVFITVGDTDVVRGTLVTDDRAVASWVTNPTDGQALGPLTLTSVVAQAGDRIVVEIGAVSNIDASIAFPYTGSIGIRASDATFADEAVAGVPNGVSWLEFDQDIVFL